MKKRRMVGTRDKAIKATTNLVLSLPPRTFFFFSKISLTTLRRMRINEKKKKEDIETDEGDNQKVAREGSLDPPGGDMGLKEEKEPHHPQE